MQRASEEVRAAVVVRNLNEGKALEHLLIALHKQDVRAAEIIVVDNESDDDSVAVAMRHGAKVVTLPRTEFTYGRALNLGIGATREKVVLLMSAHCVPVGSRFIAEILQMFASDETVAAAGCLNVAYGARLMEWHSLPKAVRQTDLQNGCPENNGCAIRRAVWELIPYNETLRMGEDNDWCARAIRAGYSVGWAPAFFYYHEPKRPFYARLRRRAQEELVLARIEGKPRLYLLKRITLFILYTIPKSAAEEAIIGIVRMAMILWSARGSLSLSGR